MMNGVFVCFNGTIQVDVNGTPHTYHKNQLVMFPPNTTLDNYLFSMDFECKALLMTNHIIQRFMRPYIDVWNHVVYVRRILERQLTEALQWIEEYTVADINYYLRSTEYSVKEIANILGFPNPSFFGKYVKQQLGCTPMEHRNKKKKQARR